ncbi:type IV toxin-antitoxin system AbiEi family antitoxin domain-containing protein [Bifidobacterium tibiigranuli]|jgi:predicted transcriptional regulator of viral defense system|uniref:type IV toxin-antitoxin system AbiEi family antitoxin domain-containing protein n=1 Tax=Bifidobacterium tibiigranuli TaxID=2172043 RepID=UPI0026F222DB|nr:hypothetical protein [Bifidobacterium tibiigranuli]MCI1649143.1 hypothetical protein [Bifidobacterium tibiigranuli]MCI2185561.1 hypothetical protein [Bifidobacterium tibiigranuli]MCI2203464.1 hypothetical protein [Bifidobacterium tibiigranuli]
MKFSEYISTHHVFLTGSLLKSADSEMAAKQQLKLALASNTVERVRRGMYASNAGRFEGAGVDPYEVVIALDADAVLSYHSALEAHGVAHNIGFECRFRTDAVKTPFTFRDVRYVPHATKSGLATQRIRGKAFGSVLATSREQTFVDCLKHPEWSGGIEEVVRSLSAMPYLDTVRVAELAMAESASMAARVGWLLEERAKQWKVQDDTLELLHTACEGVVSKLDKSSDTVRGWSKGWNMRLPEESEEVQSWLL